MCKITTFFFFFFQHRPVQLTRVRRALTEHIYRNRSRGIVSNHQKLCVIVKLKFSQVKGSGRKHRPLDATHPGALLLTQPLKLLRCLLKFPQAPLVLLLQLPHLKTQGNIIGNNEDMCDCWHWLEFSAFIWKDEGNPKGLDLVSDPPDFMIIHRHQLDSQNTRINVLVKFLADTAASCFLVLDR